MKELTPEELLKPRYKVIADYPGSQWKVEEILDRNWGWGTGDDEIGFEHSISDYPHLFNPLAWWEERTPEELTGYIKINRESGTHVYEFNILDTNLMKWKFGAIRPSEFLPATAEEYLAYTKQQSNQ